MCTIHGVVSESDFRYRPRPMDMVLVRGPRMLLTRGPLSMPLSYSFSRVRGFSHGIVEDAPAIESLPAFSFTKTLD